MFKRQDAHSFLPESCLRVLVPLLFLLSLSACAYFYPPGPTETPTHADPLPTPSGTVDLSSQKTTPAPSLTPTVDCLKVGGEVLNTQISSELLGHDLNFFVYLPPCYSSQTDQYYPVVYLLHGLSYNNEQWLRLGAADTMDALIAEDEIAPFIIILPLEGVFEPPQTSAFGDAIVEELIPWVDEHYRTLSEKTYRGIGGVSRGAAWAFRIGFMHHNVFSSVGAHSLPLFEADGGNILLWVTQAEAEELPMFYIDIGRDDQEWKTAQGVADLLDEYNIAHEWYLFSGGHTETYWSNHIEIYLRWYARDW
jgi:enterochelin esterase-like enzyme